jgi:large subunit ribosomal protein L17
MYRNMVTSLMLHGRIRTTQAKAKELRKVADRIITLGKRVPPSSLDGLEGDVLAKAKATRLAAIRRARRWVNNPEALNKVFSDYSERFKERPGGYTRVLRAGYRVGDNAPMAVVELVGESAVIEVDSDQDESVEVEAPEATEPMASEDAEAADNGSEEASES